MVSPLGLKIQLSLKPSARVNMPEGNPCSTTKVTATKANSRLNTRRLSMKQNFFQ
jgi:hypothetical protein